MKYSLHGFVRSRCRTLEAVNVSAICYANYNLFTKYGIQVRGHPFMMTTQRGQAQVGASGRWKGVSSMWMSTSKIKSRHPDVILYSSQAKKLAFFGPEFRLLV